MRGFGLVQVGLVIGIGGDGDGSEGARVWTHSATSVTEEV